MEPQSKYDQKFRKPTEIQANKRSDYSFIFNEESFMLERVLNGEKCQGCNQWIKRDELSLRHKERVPRERMDQFPLISQYYHTDRNCLFDRGFDLKYLSFIKCDAILAGDDNLAKFTEVLLKCGFSNENIIYQRSNYQETIEFGIVASFPNMPEKEYKLFVNYCDNSSRCEGCGLMLTPNKKCFIYSSTALQDDNAKVFHFRKPCLEGHFTEDQLVAMTCVNNDIVNVSPQEIINCGIVKIINLALAGLPNIPIGSRLLWKVSGNQLCTPVIKPPTVGAFSPKLTGQKPMSFIVDIVEDDRNSCVVCNNRLYLDSFIIRLTERVTKPLSVHLDPKCVKGMGYSDSELACSKLKFSISSSPALKAKLHDCGFQNMA